MHTNNTTAASLQAKPGYTAPLELEEALLLLALAALLANKNS